LLAGNNAFGFSAWAHALNEYDHATHTFGMFPTLALNYYFQTLPADILNVLCLLHAARVVLLLFPDHA
jgi:hypothetical protein